LPACSRKIWSGLSASIHQGFIWWIERNQWSYNIQEDLKVLSSKKKVLSFIDSLYKTHFLIMNIILGPGWLWSSTLGIQEGTGTNFDLSFSSWCTRPEQTE
jgi:hypothetical protein